MNPREFKLNIFFWVNPLLLLLGLLISGFLLFLDVFHLIVSLVEYIKALVGLAGLKPVGPCFRSSQKYLSTAYCLVLQIPVLRINERPFLPVVLPQVLTDASYYVFIFC